MKQNMQRIRTLILASFILWLAAAQSQNLVPNPSFENYNNCPTANSFPVTSWFNPNTATPDYFNPCGTGSNAPPNVLFGPQTARTGTCFAGAGWYGLGGGFYDYMQVQLSSPMVANTVYSVSMWVSLASGVQYASDDVGIYISTGTFKSSAAMAVVTSFTTPATPAGFGAFTSFTPQIKCPTGAFITNTSTWTAVSGTYIATGGEDAITLGCFEPWATTGTLLANPLGNGRCYYFFDDVAVEAIGAMTVAPAQPVAILGATSTCASATEIFSVAAVPGATAYTWVLPGGWTGVSTSNTISATTNTASGTLSVTANNAFGASPAQTLSVTVNNVSASVTQTGNTLYTGPASSYIWVDCNNGNTAIASGSASFSPSQSGSYAVIVGLSGCTATSACNNILIPPGQPGTISGATLLCSGATQVFNILAVPNATSYSWTLPSGWSGSSTTNSITVTVNGAAGTLSVTANNQGGPSPAQTLSVTVSTATVAVTQTGTTLYASPADTYQWLDCNNNNSVVATGASSYTPAQSGSYAVLISVNGCTAVSACSAVLLPPAQPGPVSGTSVLCAGATQIFSVAAVATASSYSWTLPAGWNGTSTSNSIAVTVNSASGTISVTANNQTGASAPQQLSITVNTVNAVAIQSLNTLYAGVSSSYQWVDCNNSYAPLGVTTQSYLPAQSGSYGVIVSQNGCTDTSACLQVNVIISGLAEMTVDNQLLVFPNPADQFISVLAGHLKGALAIRAEDQSGRLIFTAEQESDGQISIPSASWPAGVYILKITSDNRTVVRKVVIAR